MKKILLLEDQKSDIDLVCRALKSKWPDVKIDVVHKIALAKQAIETNEYDVALFDLKLPDGNGLDLLVNLRSHKSSLPIIILTGTGSEEIALTALRAGANDYITKKPGFHKLIPIEIENTLKKDVANQKQLRVLYAEHQKSDIDLTLIYFKKFAPNISFKVVPNADEVLKLLPKNATSKSTFDLLLFDYQMPGLNGLELTKVIRNERKLNIPIVIITGQGNESIVIEALKLGVNDYVVKQHNYLMRLPYVLMNVVTTIELEQKQLELVKSESKFRLLATNTLDTIFTVDLNLNITFINQAVTALSGYEPEEILKMNAKNLTTEEGYLIIKNKAADLLSENLNHQLKQVRYEIPLLKKDKSTVYIEVLSNILFDYSGKISGFQGRAIDITERKRAEQIQHVILNISNATRINTDLVETLKVIQTELGTLMDTKNLLVVKYDPINNAYDLLIYEDEKDVITEFPKGKSITRYLIKTGKSLLLKLEDVEKLEQEHKIEKIGFDSKIWLGVPLKSKGKITGAFVLQSYTNENAYTENDKEILEIISHQISLTIERKQNEENLRKALEAAQESDRLKSAFLANMSHEIRTPMNGILGFSELLKQPNLPFDKLQLYISVIEKSGIRMLNTINDIIDISKIEAGQMDVHLSKVNILEQFEEIYSFFKPEADKKGLQLTVTNTLSSDDSILTTDSVKIYAVLSNIIKNALKFTSEGSVEYGVYKNESYLEFFVKDTGIGIPENRIAHIFNRFEQADIEDKGAYEGSGLGLAIAKSYIEMLNGKIWVESKENEGSKFFFKIPYVKTL